MHISRERQVELRYALLYAQAHELTISEFMQLYIKDEREAVWFYRWQARYAEHMRCKLNRQFELHKLALQLIDSNCTCLKEALPENLSQVEAEYISKVLSTRLALLVRKQEEDMGAPVKRKEVRHDRVNAGSSTNAPDMCYNSMDSEQDWLSLDSSSVEELELEPELEIESELEIEREDTEDEPNLDSETAGRDTDTESSSSSVCPIPAEEGHTSAE